MQHEQQFKEPQATLHQMQLASDNHTTEEVRGQESIKWNWEISRGEEINPEARKEETNLKFIILDWHFMQRWIAGQGSHTEVCLRHALAFQGSPA